MTRPAPQPDRQPPPEGDDAASPATWGIELAPGVLLNPAAMRFRAVRSPGPGGQNVNKRSTKVELRLRLGDIPLPPPAAARLRSKAARHITDDGELILTSSEHRSQAQNKDACLARLRALVAAALIQPKTRRPTKPTKGSKTRRIDAKSRRGKVKRLRQDRPGESD